MSAESTSFIVDVSPTMINEGSVSKVVAYLEYTLLDKCRRGRKTDWVSCYLANCQVTHNSQSIPNVYQVQDFLAPSTSKETLNLLRLLQSYCTEVAKHEIGGDERSVAEQVQSMVQCLLVVSLDIRGEFKNRKLLKQIVIFTDDMDGLDLNDEEINVLTEELNSRLILIDCRNKNLTDSKDDDVFNSKWGQLLKAIPGSMVFEMNELLLEITSPNPNLVKPVRVFAGEMRLGADVSSQGFADDEKLISPIDDKLCLCIRVEGYPATKLVSALSRKQMVKVEKEGTTHYDAVKSVIEYEIHDETNDKNISIAQESIAKAYRYGSDYVVLPSTLDEQRYYKTVPGIDIRGFLDRKRLQRYFLNSESRFILADTRSGTIADVATFNALVDIMLEYDKIAIVRFVSKRDAEAQMCMLCPFIIHEEGNDEVRTLILNRLPFAEDERVASFPTLTNRTTTSGQKLVEDKDENSEIDALMSEYIDSLDIDPPGDKLDKIESDYYLPSDKGVKDTTLPLPRDDDEKMRLQGNDPLRIPAIYLHRQAQVLLEWIHQKLINESEEFQVPEMPDLLKEKITPHFNDKKNNENLTKLVKLLRIKETSKKLVPGGTNYDEVAEEEAAQNIPSLESLLARGQREE